MPTACSKFCPKKSVGPLRLWCARCNQHYDDHIGGGHDPDDDGPKPKAGGKKKAKSGAHHGPKPGGASDEGAASAIWQRLGGEEASGSIDFEAIVYHSRYLEAEFPELVSKYAEIADHGKVSWDSFLRLFTGGGDDKEAEPRSLRPKDLRKIFQTLDEAGEGNISLEDVIKNKDTVQRYVPELLSKWADIDCDGSHVISWDEFRTYFGGGDEWLEFQFSEIVGLDSLKDQIRRFYRSVALDKARRERGHDVASGGGRYHMIFQGSPGTGKTSLGRLIAKLLNRAGILRTTNLREVQRQQLVGEYVGQTAGKTQKEIEGAVGGILFIDEAYRLSQGGEKDFGKEAIEELMGAMNTGPDRAPVMVFAGYPSDMAEFMSKNDGLYSRIAYTFDFPDYSCTDLAEILNIGVNKKGYEIEKPLLDSGRARLADIIERNTLPRAREMMNGRMAERIFALAKQSLDARDDPSNPSVVLNRADIQTACRQIPPPPEPSGGGSDGAAGGDGTEVRRLRTQVQQLQSEVGRLQAENSRLQRELAGHPPGPDAHAPTDYAGGSRPSAGRSRPSHGPSPSHGAPRATRGTFQIKFREWTDFEPDLQERLNEALAAGERTVRFNARGREFEVDLEEMVQRSLDGGRDRQVRIQREAEDSEDASSRSTVSKFFRALDCNGDQEITRTEMTRVLTALDPGVFTRESVNLLFQEADANADRKVSPEEFSHWLLAGGDGQRAVKSALEAAGE